MARETRDVWVKRVERWLDSGLTAKEFAAEIGVNPNTLASWRWRLRREGAGRPEPGDAGTAALPFVELIAATAGAEAPTAAAPEEVEPLELVLAKGRRLRIPVRFDPGTLQRVLTALEAL